MGSNPVLCACRRLSRALLSSCAKRFASVVRPSPRQPVPQIKSIFLDYNSSSKQRSSTHQTAYKAESGGITGTPRPELFLLGPLASKLYIRHRCPHSTKSAATPRRHAPTRSPCRATGAKPRPCALLHPAPALMVRSTGHTPVFCVHPLSPAPRGVTLSSWYIPRGLPHVELYVPQALLSP